MRPIVLVPALIALSFAVGFTGGCGGGGDGGSQAQTVSAPSDNGSYAAGAAVDTAPQPDGGSYQLEMGGESAFAKVRLLLPDGSRVPTTTDLKATATGVFLLADQARQQLVARGWKVVYIVADDGVREIVYKLTGDLTGMPEDAFVRVVERWSRGRTPDVGTSRGEAVSGAAPTVGPASSVTERDVRLEEAKAKLAEIQARLNAAKANLAAKTTSRDELRKSVDDLVTLIAQLGGKVASLDELRRRLAALPWASGDEESLRASVKAIIAA
jgi:hypothetical protein